MKIFSIKYSLYIVCLLLFLCKQLYAYSASYCITGNKNGDYYIFNISEEFLKKTPDFNPSRNQLPIELKKVLEIAHKKISLFDAKKENYKIFQISIIQNSHFTKLKNKWVYSISFVHHKYSFRRRNLYLSLTGDVPEFKKEHEDIEDSRKFFLTYRLYKKKWVLNLSLGMINGEKLNSELNSEMIENTQSWNPHKENLPLSFKDATNLALKKIKQNIKNHKDFILEDIILESAPSKNKWYYIFSFYNHQNKEHVQLYHRKECIRIPVFFPVKSKNGTSISRKVKKLIRE